jgi:ribonuclease HI
LGKRVDGIFRSLEQWIQEGKRSRDFFAGLSASDKSRFMAWLDSFRTENVNKGIEREPDGVIAYCDGASRGNPGEAGYGYAVYYPSGQKEEGYGYLGKATNNVAEYRGLIAALKHLIFQGVAEASLYLDSELVVRQMNGQYQVKSSLLKELYREADELKSKFKKLKIAHVPREQNSEADRLANKAVDTKETSHFSLDF